MGFCFVEPTASAWVRSTSADSRARAAWKVPKAAEAMRGIVAAGKAWRGSRNMSAHVWKYVRR